MVLLCLAGGVAAADPLGLSDVDRSTTADGWQLKVQLNDMSINSVPNMAATAFTREGFVTTTATATITNIDGPPKYPLDKGGQLTLVAQVGCQVDVSQGDYLEFIPQFGFAPSILGTVTPGATNPTSTSIGAIPSGSMTPETQLNLKTGNIGVVPLGSIPITPDNDESTGGLDRVVSVREFQIKVDGCAGPVAVRLRATGLMETTHSVSSIDAYSDILTL